MTDEQIKELKDKILKQRGPEYLAGFAADRAAVAAQLHDDRRAIGEPADAATRMLVEYIDTLAREYAADAEGLRE